jgi:hypothetical protein
MKSKLAGAFVLVISAALLIIMRILLGPEESCEHDPSFILKGTAADCEALERTAPLPEAEGSVAAR